MPKKFKKYKNHGWFTESYYKGYLDYFSRELRLDSLEYVTSVLESDFKLAEEGWWKGYCEIDPEHKNRLTTLYKLKQDYIKELSSKQWNEHYKDIINSALNTLGSNNKCHVYRKPTINIERFSIEDSLFDYQKSFISLIESHIFKIELYIELAQRILWDNLNDYRIKSVKVDIDYFKIGLHDFTDVLVKHKQNVYYLLSVGTVNLATIKLYESYMEKFETRVKALEDVIKYKEKNFHCVITLGE